MKLLSQNERYENIPVSNKPELPSSIQKPHYNLLRGTEKVFFSGENFIGANPKTVRLEFNQVLMNGGLISPQLKVSLSRT